jgi:hypothetical protein
MFIKNELTLSNHRKQRDSRAFSNNESMTKVEHKQNTLTNGKSVNEQNNCDSVAKILQMHKMIQNK